MLSRGAISSILNDQNVPAPTFVVQSVKAVGGTQGQTRNKLSLFDGAQTIQGMLATQQNELVENGDVCEGAIITVEEYVTNSMGAGKIMIMIRIVVKGNDKSLLSGAAPAPAPAHVSAAMPPTAAPMPPAAPAAAASHAPAGHYTPYQSGGNARPVASNSASYGDASSAPATVPISALNPYMSRWTIRARITNKSDIRSWSNAKGDGTLFSIDLLDSDNDSIRCTFFKEACERFYPLVDEGKVYYFTGGKIKPNNSRQFNNTKSNYEITFDTRSDIRECLDAADIKTASYEFVAIKDIAGVEPGSVVDVVGVVKMASDVSTIISQKQGGKELKKRELTLVDSSGADIRLTLWGDKAVAEPTVPYSEQPIGAFKGVKVGDFGGRSLTAQGSTSVAFNPDLQEAYDLHNWRSQFEGGAMPATTVSLSSQGSGIERGAGGVDPLERRKTISAIKDENLGHKDKPDFLSIKSTITFIKHDADPWYCACPTEGCNKKVTENFAGTWECLKCNSNFETCNRRFILSLNMSDATGQNWFGLFNDQAEKVLGVTAQELYDMKAQGEAGEAEYEAVFQRALFRDYVCKVKVKAEQVQEETRVKATAIGMVPVDPVYECGQLLQAIEKYNAQ